MKPLISATATLSAALLLGACSGPQWMTTHHYGGIPSTFTHAASKGDVLTMVTGNPYPGHKSVLEKTVLGAMPGNHFGPPARFTTAPAAAGLPKIRFVWAFDPSPALHNDDLCGKTPETAARTERHTLHLTALLCEGGQAQSSVVASLPRPTTADDPALKSLVQSIMWELIPERDPFNDGCTLSSNC